MTDATDRPRWLMRAKLGEQEAWAKLCGSCEKKLLAIVRARLGPHLRRLLDAEDILQETYLAASQSLQAFHWCGDDSLLHWLVRIADHKIADAVRYYGCDKRCTARDERLDAGGFPGSTPELMDDSSEPTRLADLHEQEQVIDHAVATLRSPYRDLILLREYAGTPWPTIAEVLGSPTASAARMMHRTALAKLAQHLHDREEVVQSPSADPHLESLFESGVIPEWIRWLGRPTWVCRIHEPGRCSKARAEAVRRCSTADCIGCSIEECLSCTAESCAATRSLRPKASIVPAIAQRWPGDGVRILHLPWIDPRTHRIGSINTAWPATPKTQGSRHPGPKSETE